MFKKGDKVRLGTRQEVEQLIVKSGDPFIMLIGSVILQVMDTFPHDGRIFTVSEVKSEDDYVFYKLKEAPQDVEFLDILLVAVEDAPTKENIDKPIIPAAVALEIDKMHASGDRKLFTEMGKMMEGYLKVSDPKDCDYPNTVAWLRTGKNKINFLKALSIGYIVEKEKAVAVKFEEAFFKMRNGATASHSGINYRVVDDILIYDATGELASISALMLADQWFITSK